MPHNITSIHFKNYKAFSDFSVTLGEFNVLVGPNNAGKSTVLGALRILAEAIRKANSRNPEWVPAEKNETFGYRVDLADLPVSTENVFHDYNDAEPAVITFRVSNGNKLRLVFPERGKCSLICDAKKVVRSVSSFKSEFDLRIAFVPVLGPVEHNEQLFLKETARRALLTSYASRNFRNIWHHYPERFKEFREMVQKTWPGMDIEPPERTDREKLTLLHMFCPEERFPREIFWAGFGFQVWCQMLTFLLQARGASLFVIDEPDIYLHSDLQRQLVSLLKELDCHVVLATHSTEIISEVEPDCILNINKRYRSGRRITNSKELQDIFSTLGSNLNPTLTQIAKSKRVVFVEGKDFQLFSRFARKLGLDAVANRSDFAVIPVEGFNPNRVKDFAHGVESTLGSKLLKAVIFDRDYRSQEEANEICAALGQFCKIAQIHERKEVENFVLIPSAITRAIARQAARRGIPNPATDDFLTTVLLDITAAMKNRIQANFVKLFCEFKRRKAPGVDVATFSEFAMNEFDRMWASLDSRLNVVSGKETLSALNALFQNKFGLNVTAVQIIDCMSKEEMPKEMIQLLSALDEFRRFEPPAD